MGQIGLSARDALRSSLLQLSVDHLGTTGNDSVHFGLAVEDETGTGLLVCGYDDGRYTEAQYQLAMKLLPQLHREYH
ncbi:hypothetical protein TNIN_278291 [Trichonephila inaurata madagascariensis]|uniref:Uncharacterized protein n=1 Tax=Trichonephila inaurata madagascariensis TaxID=2747483 RepID=A0A8X6YWM5_9ARAC|nr:hypothetical protein TNIN_278291 [Trichonephila inaurata madagascariensis]